VIELRKRKKKVMGIKTEAIIKALQNISAAKNQQEKKVLVAKFKHDFPENLDWLDMFSEDKVAEFEKYQTQLPEIEGYKLLKTIGSGASGQVFLATELNSNKKVAIKIPMIFLTTEQMHRFAHESRLLSRLSHSNIARIEETGLIAKDNLPFIVMEYVDGKTIHQYCKDEQLNFKQIIELFKQVLDAVQYAHNKGIVHRDIKPENILVNNQGQVKLLDFGIALATNNSTQQLTQLTKTGEIVGTLAYMSPEQVSGNDDLDTRADVYSLGVVLYQLLSDSLPYQVDAGKIFAAISQIIEDLPKKLTTQNHKIDANLATIVHHAIEKSPEARYQSPRDFKNDLDNWIKGEGISVKQQSLWHSLKHLAQQHKAIVTGAALAVAGLILGLVFAVSFAVKEQKAREIAEVNKLKAEISAKTNKHTSNFINKLLVSADPNSIHGDKITMLQAIENAEDVIKQELDGEELVELNVRVLLAHIYVSIGKNKKSQEQIDKAKNILSNYPNLEEYSEINYEIQLTQANIYRDRNETEKLIKLIQNVMPTLKSYPVHEFQMKNALAYAYYTEGKIDKAEVVIAQALKKPSPEVKIEDKLTIQSTQAMLMLSKGEFKNAKKLNESILKEKIQIYGKDHRAVLTTLNSLANIDEELGNLDDAAKTYLKIIKIENSREYGDSSIPLTTKLSYLHTIIKNKKMEEAYEYSQGLLNEMLEKLGENHQLTLEVRGNRAYILENLGKLKEAKQQYIELMKIISKRKTKDVPSLAVENNYAMLLEKLGEYQHSQQMYKKLLNDAKSTVGENHVYYALFSGNYGELLLSMKEYKMAKPILVKSHEKILATFGENHERTRKAKKRLEQLAKHE
jgi:serine/threonine protein kinase